MAKVPPFHAGDEDEKVVEVYHIFTDCPAAKKITTGRPAGKIGRMCELCQRKQRTRKW
jgi:hypothetical protein